VYRDEAIAVRARGIDADPRAQAPRDSEVEPMGYEVAEKELPTQTALTVRKRVTVAALPQAMGEAFGAIMSHLQTGGAQPVGPPYTLYPGEMAQEFDVIVCMPVAPGATAGPGTDLEEVPGGAVASVLHKGPYSGIGAAYEALQAWMEVNGRRPGGPPREVYLNSPSEVPESELLTEIDWPVA
jgi:effector-binding domain-containing protein